ncbi:MAG TPA: glycosyl hydrolase, partial [Acidobacteriaceae bacterium]|nr:glycosyl hydrolase [Acidobacteriaceae bacterium]
MLNSVRVLAKVGLGLWVTVGASGMLQGQAKPSGGGTSLVELERNFASPPTNAEPMMRWWWFGPAVDPEELARELRTMKQGGIGGVEIQPVYPLALDDPQERTENEPFLSPEFLRNVSFAARTGQELGMRVSLTLGSGWPYGGAWVPVNESAGELRVVADAIGDGDRSVAVPAMENGEQLLGAFLAAGNPARYDAAHAERVETIRNGRLELP